MRSIEMRPAPRSMRRLKVCASSLHPVLPAMRAASSSPFSRSARPVSSSTAGSPERSTRAASFTASSLTFARSGIAGTFAGPVPSSHAVSPGRISVATCPGGFIAAAIAIAPSSATVFAVGEVFTQPENGFAAVSMSEVSGES